MATEKATTTSELSGRALITDTDEATAQLSADDRKTSTVTLKGGTKITGPTEVVNKLKARG